MRVWLLVVVALAACDYPVDLVLCTDGRACPAGTVCDDVHRSCATDQQLAACDDVTDATPCETDALLGACHAGVCIARGCGNTLVEPGELCDDGNQLSGDGCRADCASNEGCGNGVTDPGEECDDGNAISSDGCDSICAAESVRWEVQPIQPRGGYLNRAAFDPIRGRLVYVADYVTWEWDGIKWTGVTHTVKPARVAYWNTDRQRIQTITTTDPPEVWDWDGTSWSRWVTLTNAPPDDELWGAGYDPVRHYTLVFTFDGYDVYTIDQAGTTTVLDRDSRPNIGGNEYGTIVFDPNTNRLLAHGWGPVYEFDGTTWTTTSVAALPDRGGRLMYRPDLGRIWIAGGNETGEIPHTKIYERALDGNWSLVPDVALPFTYSQFELLYDTTRNQLVHALRAGSHGDVSIWNPTLAEWEHSRVGFSANQQGTFVADPLRGRMLYFGGYDALGFDRTNEVWAWDGTTWIQLSLQGGPPPQVGAQAIYDPTRDAVIFQGGSCDDVCTDTWQLVGSTWTMLEGGGPQYSVALAMAYDPIERRIIVADGFAIWELPSNGTHWNRKHDIDYMSIGSVAWSARDGVFTATESNGGVVDMVGEHWVETLSPGTGYIALEDSRSGGVVFMPVRSGGGGQLWQRLGGSWDRIDISPSALAETVSYDPRTGRIVTIGEDGGGSYVTMIRILASANPTESCVDGEDRDTDTLAGCDDPDCWYACAARCPPYASCP